MRKIRSIVAVVLALIFIFQIVPIDYAKADVNTNADNPKVTGFFLTINGVIYNLLNTAATKITYPAGAPFKFAVRFDIPASVAECRVVSINAEAEFYIDAVWDAESHAFIAEGYFDYDNAMTFTPGQLKVEYTKKVTKILVDETFNPAQYIDVDGIFTGLSSDDIVVYQNGSTTNATINFSNATNSIGAGVLEMSLTTIDSTYGANITGSMSEWNSFASYIVPGVDENKYVLSMDCSNPDTWIMIARDVTNSKAIQFVVKDAGGENLANGLKTAGGALNMLSQAAGINESITDIRSKISLSNTSDEKKAEMNKKANELERDQAAAFATSILVDLALAGATGGASVVCGCLFSAVQMTGEYFVDNRIAGILDETASDSLSWSIDAVSYTSGSFIIRDYGDEWTDPKLVVVGYTGSSANVVIPRGVIGIAYGAFDGCAPIQSLYIPDTVKTIQYLGEATIKSITVSINSRTDGSTFLDCNGLESMYYYGTHTGPDPITGDYNLWCDTPRQASKIVFGPGILWPRIFQSDDLKDSTVLKDIVIMGEITEIPDELFSWCTGLNSISFPSSVTRIGGSAFYGCENLESISSLDRVRTIEGGAFSGCESLNSIHITNSLESIGGGAFSSSGLQSVYIPPATEIGIGAFSYCNELISVEMGANIKTIPEEAFYNCESLMQVVLPNNLESIDRCAFDNCWSLCAMQLPDSLVSIGYRAFACCNLTEVEIPSGVETISDSAFIANKNLEQVTLNDGLITIESSAFGNCQKLESINLPTTLAYLSGGAFERCTSLQDVYIASNIKGGNPDDIGYLQSPFTNFRHAIILDGVTRICDGLFSCSIDPGVLETISIPDTLTEIGNSAFEDFTGIAQFDIPASVTRIDAHAFDGWPSTSRINIYNKDCNYYFEPTTGDDVGPLFCGYPNGQLERNAQKTYDLPFARFKVICPTVSLRESNEATLSLLDDYYIQLDAEGVSFNSGLNYSISITDDESKSLVLLERIDGTNTLVETDHLSGTIEKKYSYSPASRVCGWISLSNDAEINTPQTAKVTITFPPSQNEYYVDVPEDIVITINIAQKTPPTPDAATTAFSTESLTGLSSDMEYCISEDPTYSAGSFTPVPEGTSSLDLSSLIPNAGAQPKYLHLRMKAANGGTAGDITSVTIPPRQATPEIAIDYINERTEQKLPDTMLYGTGTDATTIGNNAYLPLTPGVTMGFRVAATDSSFQSNLQQLTLPERPAAPQGVAKTDESARGAGDGTLTNLNSTMEYRLGTSADWTSIGENETQLTGLSAGTYQVRTKAVAGSSFSSEITELTITPGNAFIVTFASNDGTDVANTENVTANTGIAAPQPPTKVGYTFEGWYENTELTDAWDFAVDTVTNDTTLYAKWLPATDTAYTVKHYQQDLSGNGYTLMSEESGSGTTGSQLALSSLAKTVDGFTYAIGKIDDTAAETASILADGSLVIGLYYTRNATYTVTFETNGHGTAPSALTGLSFGAAIQAPSPTPTADGMRFYGWFRESNCLTAWDFDVDTISGSITLYAGWTPAAPTVTPTPTPTGTPTTISTPDPVPTATPTPTPTAKPTPTPTAVPDPVPPPTPTTVPVLPPPMPPIATATPTASPVIPPASTPTAPPTATPAPTPTASSTVQPAGGANTPIPTSTATLPPLPPPPTPVNTPIPTPPSGTIWTPTPTATLSPTASPTPTPAITPPIQPAPEVPHALTVVAGTGIKSVTGAGEYKPGVTVTVNAEVADGYTWQGWQSSSPTVAAGIQKAYNFAMPASAVTMTAVAVLNQYKVSFRTGQHCTMTGTSAADSFNAYTDRLVAENGYPLPKTLKATMGGVDFTDFTYNSNTGEIAIEAGKIKGDILFASLYSITYDADLQHGTISGEFPKACYTSYSGMITPETGRLLPQKLTAELNGEQFTDFTYNNTIGAVLIEADKTAADIVFTGVCPLNKCSITYPDGQHGTITGTDSANYETSYTDVLVPEKGYALPVALTATISATGSDPQPFTQFAYNNTTGAIDIAAGVILGNITFEGACTLAQFAISYVPGQHATLTGTTTADMFTEYRDTLVPESGFGLPVKLYAEMDGNDFTSFIYDGSDGSLWIKEGRIKGDIVFAGAYSISYDPAQNGAITGASAEHYFSSYQDVLVPAPGFQLPTTLRATMEGVAFTDFTYDKESGAITIATGTILGNIVFQGDCTPTAYSVSYAAEQHGSITGTDNAVVSSDYTDTLIPEGGYLRPNTLTATMDGSAFTAFTYDNITGTIRIAAGQILGDIVFSGLCTPTDVLPPTITTQPENVSADYGYTEKSTSIVAADQEYCELSYQWYANGENANTGGTLIANAIAATLSLPDGRPVGKHYFYCVVTATHQSSLHVNSTASNTMTLTVLQIKPVFDKHPVDIIVVDSESAEFTSNATGGPAPSLQWEVSMDDGATWNNATGTGATTNTYTTANVTPGNNGYRYRCAATALDYTVYSDVAVLTVERNRVVGLRSNAVIERGEEITFTAVGAGMENTAPEDGDVRFEPVDWKINSSGAFERGGPYAASFSTEKMKLGSHTLTVRYQRQVYDATIGDWIAEPGELASVRVPEKIVSAEVPLTGDDAPIALLLCLIAGNALLLTCRLRRRRRRNS